VLTGGQFQQQYLRLIAPNDASVARINQECRLFNVMARAGETANPRNDLLEALGYPKTDVGHRSLNAALLRLRAKVTEATGLALPIQTVRGLGYVARNLLRERRETLLWSLGARRYTADGVSLRLVSTPHSHSMMPGGFEVTS